MNSRRSWPGLAGLALAASCLFAGCAAGPVSAVKPLPAARAFTLEARFALRAERPGEAAQSASGRLSWRHAQEEDDLLLASPLGQTLAEIRRRPGETRLTTADGRERADQNAARLLFDATGVLLPLDQLPGWLQGRAADPTRRLLDAAGRVRHLSDQGWQIDYAYPDETSPSAHLLTIRRENELELRLRIESFHGGE